jgi:predicted nuclease with TOPRIM domain
MSFTVEDFHDLIELLAQHPEWRAELRRHVLSDALLELPALVRQLVEAQTRTEARLEGVEGRLEGIEGRVGRVEAALATLAEAQTRTEARLDGIEGRVDRVEAALAALAEAQTRAEARLERVEVRLDGLESALQALVEAQTRAAQEIRELAASQRRSEVRLGSLDGRMIEWDYARHAPSSFGSIVRRLRVLDSTALADLLDDGIDEGRLTWDERTSILLADLVMSGRRRDDSQDVYLLAEISAGIRSYDVERAADRAALLEKLGRPVLPIVAGREIDEGTARLAHNRGVWLALDGRVSAPNGA